MPKVARVTINGLSRKVEINNPLIVLITTAVWSAAFGGAPSIYQTCAVRTHTMPPERAGAWINATANVGIAGGSAIGAGLLETAGLSTLPWVGALLIGLGLVVIMLSPRAFPVGLQRA